MRFEEISTSATLRHHKHTCGELYRQVGICSKALKPASSEAQWRKLYTFHSSHIRFIRPNLFRMSSAVPSSSFKVLPWHQRWPWLVGNSPREARITSLALWRGRVPEGLPWQSAAWHPPLGSAPPSHRSLAQLLTSRALRLSSREAHGDRPLSRAAELGDSALAQPSRPSGARHT